MKVIRKVSETVDVEIVTADGAYRMTGSRTSNPNEVTNFQGGSIINGSGQIVANIQSWSKYGGMTIQYVDGGCMAEVAAAIQELNGALIASVAQEGGEA